MSLYFCFAPEDTFSFTQFSHKRKMQFTFAIPFASSSAPASFQQRGLLPIFSCYSPVPRSPAWPYFTIQFSQQFCLNMGGFVFSSTFPILTHTDGAQLCEVVAYNCRPNSGLQFQIATNPLQQLCQSQLVSSPLQHVKILSLRAWET